MKWTDKRIKEYLNDGNEILLSQTADSNAVSWVQWVRRKVYQSTKPQRTYPLTPEIYDELDRYDKRRVKHFLGDHTCFQYFYNKRLKAYEAERNALDNQNAPTNS